MRRIKRTPQLGQHFLASHDIARQVAEAAGVAAGDTVLEVGPGRGILTGELLALGATVVAVEKDPALVTFLEETFAQEIRASQLTVHTGDIRDFLKIQDSRFKTQKYKLVANIPYYITGEIIRLALSAEHQPTDISLLVQKEVAQRVVDRKKESLLSLSVKVYGEPTLVRTVKPGSFNPPPSVDSAILAIRNISRSNFSSPTHEKRFFELLHIGFGQKRKTLAGNLTKAGVKDVTSFLTKLGLDPKVRAEDVPLTAWLELTGPF